MISFNDLSINLAISPHLLRKTELSFMSKDLRFAWQLKPRLEII